MKRNILNTLWMAAALPLAFASCQQEELPGVTDTAGAQVFSITVTDGGYHSDGNAAGMTRATENGYSTEFTAGDACGLYIVRGNTIVHKNVKLTATEQDGTLTWQPASGEPLTGGLPGDTYFLYYPYQADMEGKTDAAATTDDATFFAPLISGWQPAEDQSDYATGYTASDLMTAQGNATESSDGTLQLSFTMHHRMALAVIEMPTVTYKFANTTGGTITDYTVITSLGFAYSDTKPCLMTDGTHRYLVNPAGTAPSITGTYSYDKMEFTATLSGITAGQYKTYKPTNVIQHTLQVGDFLMADGTLVSKDETLTEEQKANVAAIVFWSPAETAPESRTTPANLTDDKIMAADFPGCNHGLAVAVKKATYNGNERMNWQNPYEFVNDFQNSENFTHDRKSDFASIASGTGNTANINRILGYQNTQVLLAYNKYCTDSGKEDYIVNPAAAIVEFAQVTPAPAGSTGWFLPSAKELHILCYKDVDDVYNVYNSSYIQTRDIVNTSLTATDGDNLESLIYWSSSEYESNSRVFALFFQTASNDYLNKNGSMNRVRVVCAF
ncbi:MAG: fimbrillin family protein [Bacteroidales bacterium]|nr:fimbrillin family protein [Bacteroidales bacterium]